MNSNHEDVYLIAKMYHEINPGSVTGVPTLIGRCESESAKYQLTIIGEMHKPVIGERYRVWGEWKENLKRGTKDFHFYAFEILSENTVKGIVDYLARYVPEIGKNRSKEIVDKFGAENCLRILKENPLRLKEIPGIGPATIQAVVDHFEANSCPVDPVVYASVYDLLSEGKPNQKVILKIMKDFGSNAVQVIKENPYILMDYSGIGWPTVDKIAIKKLKYDQKGIKRHRAAALEILQQISDQGHTVVDAIDIATKSSQEIKIKISQEAIDSLVADGTLIEFDTPLPNSKLRKSYALAWLYLAEQEIAYRLKDISNFTFDPLPEIDVTGLEKEQIEACKFVASHPLSILTGLPGSGKTTSSTKIIETLYKNNFKITFAAPTGKAAKRASEVLQSWIPNNDINPSTIHRALSPMLVGGELGVPEENAKFGRDRDRFEFSHNEENPIPTDFVFIDETSMIDTSLMLSLLRAIAPGTRLCFIGDENQLPSVGPGSVLRDMIRGGIPTFALTEIRRNSGRIVQATHAIKQGKTPVFSSELDLSKGENLFHFECKDIEKIPYEILDLFDQTSRDPFNDIQVISPQNTNLPIACENLNNLLSAKLNPNGKRSDHQSKHDKYKIGDKVVRTKNGFVKQLTLSGSESDLDFYYESDDDDSFYWKENYYSISKTYVVNGDMGRVLDVVKSGRRAYTIVLFNNPDRLCLLPANETHISQSYAVTTHKFQGSGAPAVIIPVHSKFHWNHYTNTGAWCREQIFTSISRGIDVVITVGEFAAIPLAIGRRTIDKRNTSLASIISKEFKS